MKNRINLAIFFLCALMIGLFSCQEESQELIQATAEEQILPNSPLGTLLFGTAANSGSSDDFLDNSSCFTVDLPVTITIGSTVITISDGDDLDDLEDLIDDLYDGDADIEFEFPITIVFGDYSELVIENEEQLEELYDNCDPDIDEDDIIECIDIEYPISFSIFNSVFDTIDTVVIQNDEQLYNFLDDLEDDDNVVIASLNYPVTLVYPNGDTVDVNSNQELAEALEAVGDDCVDDYTELCDRDEVYNALVACPWELDADSNDFEDLYLDFNENDTVEVSSVDGPSGSGNWTLTDNVDGLVLSLSGLGDELNFLIQEWLIVECDDDELEIEHGDFNFELYKECEIDEGAYSCFEEVDAQIVVCDDGTDGPYTFDLTTAFEDCANDSTVLTYYETYVDAESATNPVTNPEAYQQVDTDGTIYIRVEIDNTFEIFDIDLHIEDCGSDGNCSAEQVAEYLESCDWTVTSFNGDDQLLIYELSFEDDNILEITNTETDEVFDGIWEVQNVGAEAFLFISNVAAPEIQAINGDWTLVECSESYISLLLNDTEMIIESDCN